ncbi:MAG: hypothetical protein Q8R30_00965 [bacterium]|nr:hypothetical protein [bacterium]
METLEKVYEFAYRKTRDGIILDTVVFLLFLIGKHNSNAIKDFEPTHNYSKEDYELLNRIISPFKKIIVTPQVIAEVSNHSLKHLFDARLQQYLCVVVDFLKNTQKTEEHHVKFNDWTDRSIGRLCTFGFVDMGMYEIAEQKGIPILTDEKALYNFSKNKIPIIKLSIIKNSNMSQIKLVP